MRYTYLFILAISAGYFSCSRLVSHEENNPAEWRSYQGGDDRNQFSPLKEITSENIKDLEIAWVYKTADIDSNDRTQIHCNPSIIDGVLFGTTPKLKCFALEASTGKEIWKFTPETSGSFNFSMGVNRGLTYWEEGQDKRIF